MYDCVHNVNTKRKTAHRPKTWVPRFMEEFVMVYIKQTNKLTSRRMNLLNFSLYFLSVYIYTWQIKQDVAVTHIYHRLYEGCSKSNAYLVSISPGCIRFAYVIHQRNASALYNDTKYIPIGFLTFDQSVNKYNLV